MRIKPLGHRPALDGLRGVAVLLVMAFHTWHLPGGGFLGVNVFFVLSGFLITNLLLVERGETGRVDLMRFYARRARRLVPALLAAACGFLLIRLCAVALGADASELGPDVIATVASVTYISNVLIAGHAAGWVDAMRQLWSLAAEEQFYLLWPPILLVLLARFRSLRTAAIVVAVGVVAIWAHRWRLTLAGAPQARLYFAPDTSLDPILIGCGLALLHAAGRLRRLPVAPALAVAAAIVVMLPNTEPRWIYTWGLPLFGVCCGIVLADVILEPRARVSRMLESYRLRQLGRISYGVYLWHPILLFGAHVPATLSIPAAIGAAALSHRFVEQRFRRRRKVIPRVAVVPA
jgi:peptidoglycan/LPS O-acetylase OafA/YrhL